MNILDHLHKAKVKAQLFLDRVTIAVEVIEEVTGIGDAKLRTFDRAAAKLALPATTIDVKTRGRGRLKGSKNSKKKTRRRSIDMREFILSAVTEQGDLCQAVARQVNTSYSVALRHLERLQHEGLVSRKKNGQGHVLWYLKKPTLLKSVS